MAINLKAKYKLYTAETDLWILGTFYRKGQQLQLPENTGANLISLGHIKEVIKGTKNGN